MKVYSLVVGFENEDGFVEWEETLKKVFVKLEDAKNYLKTDLSLEFISDEENVLFYEYYERKEKDGIYYGYIKKHELI